MTEQDKIQPGKEGYVGRTITDLPIFFHPLALKKLSGCRRIVDLGCGIGKLHYTFPDAELIGVDRSAEAAVCLKRGYAKFIQCDLETEPLPDLKADALVGSHIVEHFLRPDQALLNALAGAAKDAVIYLAAPTIKNAKYFDDYTHIRPFTDKSLVGLMTDTGIGQIQILYDLRRIFPGSGRLLAMWIGGNPNRANRLAEKHPFLRGRFVVQAIGAFTGSAA